MKREVLTVKQRNQLKVDHKEYNKRLRSKYLHAMQMSLDDYIDYRQGYYHGFKEFQATKKAARRAPTPQVRETQHVPSMTSGRKRVAVGEDTWSDAQERIEISKSYTIVPAYNKGPYMVVPKSELHTAGKKV